MAIMLCVISAVIINAVGSPDDRSSLLNLISDNEDVRMNAEDLAFFLVTHGFDATPKGDYVLVKLDGTAYKLVPNGDKPGLAEITSLN
jgi:hypothetical protein